jgi:limonene-1,2-epoxide hydrolase
VSGDGLRRGQSFRRLDSGGAIPPQRFIEAVADSQAVLTERLDYIQTPDGAKPAVPVMGTFIIGDNGKIVRWTDYFDVGLTLKLLQGEDISELIPATAHP